MTGISPFPRPIVSFPRDRSALDSAQRAQRIIAQVVKDIEDLMALERWDDHDIQHFAVLSQWVSFDFICTLAAQGAADE